MNGIAVRPVGFSVEVLTGERSAGLSAVTPCKCPVSGAGDRVPFPPNAKIKVLWTSSQAGMKA